MSSKFVVFYCAQALLWLSITKFGGVRWLKRSLAAAILLDPLAPRWTEEGIRLFAWLSHNTHRRRAHAGAAGVLR
jgi:hypothetical protein